MPPCKPHRQRTAPALAALLVAGLLPGACSETVQTTHCLRHSECAAGYECYDGRCRLANRGDAGDPPAGGDNAVAGDSAVGGDEAPVGGDLAVGGDQAPGGDDTPMKGDDRPPGDEATGDSRPPGDAGCPQAVGADIDLDGYDDLCDNCPTNFNPGQEDLDDDQLGDVCDFDRDGIGGDDGSNGDYDGDGVPNGTDTCPYFWDEDQTDADGDGVGDACDAPTSCQGAGSLAWVLAATRQCYVGNGDSAANESALVAAMDARCVGEFGSSFHWATWNGEQGWSLTNGVWITPAPSTKMWMWISNQTAECYSTRTHGLSRLGVNRSSPDTCDITTNGGGAHWYDGIAGARPRDGTTSDPYQGDMPCASCLPLLCVKSY